MSDSNTEMLAVNCLRKTAFKSEANICDKYNRRFNRTAFETENK